MIPFGGWDMPVQYLSILSEHAATREHAGLFDVSHMGEILIEGDDDKALEFLEFVTCNQVSDLVIGKVQYNAILNRDGGIVDDVTIYKFSETSYFICCNASNTDAVFAHLNSLPESKSVAITNKSSEYHQIAIQGPKAESIFAKYLNQDLFPIPYYGFQFLEFQNEKILVSRTGYTGEDGFEIYTSPKLGTHLWSSLLDFGKNDGLVPVGLGARDTLRIEAKYPLYGHELNENWTPVESGIGFFTKEKRQNFLGKEKILDQKKNGPSRKIVGLHLLEPGIFRENMKIFSEEGKEIGITTSGTHSPTRKESIGLGMLANGFWKQGTPVQIEIRGALKRAEVFTEKFIKGSVKKG